MILMMLLVQLMLMSLLMRQIWVYVGNPTHLRGPSLPLNFASIAEIRRAMTVRQKWKTLAKSACSNGMTTRMGSIKTYSLARRTNSDASVRMNFEVWRMAALIERVTNTRVRPPSYITGFHILSRRLQRFLKKGL